MPDDQYLLRARGYGDEPMHFNQTMAQGGQPSLGMQLLINEQRAEGANRQDWFSFKADAARNAANAGARIASEAAAASARKAMDLADAAARKAKDLADAATKPLNDLKKSVDAKVDDVKQAFADNIGAVTQTAAEAAKLGAYLLVALGILLLLYLVRP